jgi:diketogulonate reductase-like aldo/keto reductase
MVAHLTRDRQRKTTLVALGTWAFLTGRGWLVRAVHAALEREGLRHA